MRRSPPTPAPASAAAAPPALGGGAVTRALAGLRKGLGRLLAALLFLFKLYVLARLADHAAASCWDNTLWEPSTTCEGQPQLANRSGSGVQVLVYGMAKTGTKSLTKALHRVGFDNTFHSEDFLYLVWTGLADSFWRRHGGQRLATGLPPASKGGMFSQSASDLRVLAGLSEGALAGAVANCGVDALAFDAMEELIWPIYNASPGVKVVSLSWRSFREYEKSWTEFNTWLPLLLHMYACIISSPRLFPYNVVVFPLMELLSGGAVDTWLRTGGPPITLGSGSLAKRYFHQAVVHRRWSQHVFSGLERRFTSEVEYLEFFEEARRRVPPGDLFEWDMRRHTMRDLCLFLGRRPGSEDWPPACDEPGLLPKTANLMYIERESPLSTLALIPLYALFHYMNWRLIGLLFSLLRLALIALLRGLLALLGSPQPPAPAAAAEGGSALGARQKEE